ncbi:MAG: DUF3899 domain-containing protein [Firmicutes bacterium]|nr:DUF3899 domain-containing protein [Bacillota bacterium]
MKYGRFLFIYLIMFVLAFLLHLWIYGTHFSYANASNVIFAVGIIFFLPSIAAITHAYRIFQGFNYMMRTIMSSSFKSNYPKFIDFKKDKDIEIQTTLFLEILIASATFVVAGFVLAAVAMS